MAEHGGWLREFGSISAVDKELDNKPEKNHQFLNQRASLVTRKQENPKCRITAANNNLKEKIFIEEERRTGLQGPRVQWLELKKYEKRYGKANPSSLRSHLIDGKMVTGVDFVHPDEPWLCVISIIGELILFCT